MAGVRSWRPGEEIRDRGAARGERVARDEVGDERIVAGIARDEPRELLAAGLLAERPEALAADVDDVGVVAEHVAPAVGGGAQAEVVLLAVAAAEGRGVEVADRVECRAPDDHAEAD